MLRVTDLPLWFLAPFAVALGLVFGSFLNVVIHRLPRGLSVVHPPSHCPSCGKPIRFYDNIPVLSWLVLRGRARCCKARISVRYVLVELLGGLVAWATLNWTLGITAPTAPWYEGAIVFSLYLYFAMNLLAGLFIDLEYMILPDELTLGAALVGLVTIFLRPIDLLVACAGGVGGFLIIWLPFIYLYQRLRGHPGMGLGDAKLLVATGVWLGWQGALFALTAGAVQGTLVAFGTLAIKGNLDEPEAVRREREELRAELERLSGPEREELERELADDLLAHEPPSGLGKARLAFGPFLALATLEYLFFGDVIGAWYRQWIWLS